MCGVAGAFEIEGAQGYVQSMMFAIQHRGQESCGLASVNAPGPISGYKGMGLVKQVFTPDVLERFAGRTAIGHVRYPTAGSSDQANSQPHIIELAQGPILAICSNGDLINYAEKRAFLENEHGFTFKSDNDAELIGRMIAFHYIVTKKTMEESIELTQKELKGAFSSLVIFKNRMYAFRDPHGIRPLIMGRIHGENSEGTVFASEDCTFGIIGAERIREVEPGEILRLEPGKPVTTVSSVKKAQRHCVFEHIYFSRPDTKAFGELVYQVRQKIGEALASYDNFQADPNTVVMPVPDSSNFIALGYAQSKGIDFNMGLLRNHYVGRTFIKPAQDMRDEGVKQKFNPLPDFFPGKRVILVDDSIVRGTSVRKIVRMLKGAGASEVHVRIGSPKVIGPCFYGTDTPTKEELIANRMSEHEIAEFISADSIRYMQVEDFKTILTHFEDFCFACFNLDYIYPPSQFGTKTNAPKPTHC